MISAAPAYETLALFDELLDDAPMVSVVNGIRAELLLHETDVRAEAVLHETDVRAELLLHETDGGRLGRQRTGDVGEFQFASAVIEHRGTWQKASTDAQPHDCVTVFADERTLMQIKSSETQQPEGCYRVGLGAHRIGVQAFAVMIRHQDVWLSPWIMPASVVRKRRWIQVWPTSAARRLRRGEFNTSRWRNAWWVIDPTDRTERQQNALKYL